MSDQMSTTGREPGGERNNSSEAPPTERRTHALWGQGAPGSNQGSSGSNPNPAGSPGTANQSSGPQLPGWATWALVALLFAWSVLPFLPIGAQTVSLPYTDFVTQVRQGNVSQVDFNGQTIYGTFRQAVTWPPADASSAPAQTGNGGSSNGAQSASSSGSYTLFTTVMPPTTDPDLLPLLKSEKVTVTAHDTTSSGGFLGPLFFGVLPILLTLGFLYYSRNTLMRSGQGILGFGGSKARVFDPEHPSVSFADVAGADDAKVELQEVVDFLKEPDKYRKLGARLPRGVLLVGPPGVGKTLIAKAVAGEAHVPFYSISASEFVEMFVGVGASRVRDLFAKAKSTAPSIVFVDELDAVGRSRGAGVGGSNDEREQTLNQLLVEMDGFDETTNVIVLAATNRPDVLDSALLRPGRFDRQVTLGYPDRTGREAILRVHTKNLPLDPDVSIERIAQITAGFSGADLANLANEAALLAAREGRTTVSMAQFEEALDKIILGTQQAALTDPAERRTVAYHEGGHALVALLTPGADPVQKITIVPHGRALGVTEQRTDDDKRNYSRSYLYARLAVMLGGRAAEEVVLGEPTTGAESDLKGATSLARRMVGLWGMSDELGPVSYGVGETHAYLGGEVANEREYAESTASRMDAAVASLIGEARERAIGLLRENRTTLDAVATELVDRENMSGDRLAEILAETSASSATPTGIAAVTAPAERPAPVAAAE